jgi:hypothetical protein
VRINPQPAITVLVDPDHGDVWRRAPYAGQLRQWATRAEATGGYLVVFAVPFLRNYFELELFWDPAWFYSAIAVAVAGVLIVAIPLVIPTRTQR